MIVCLSIDYIEVTLVFLPSLSRGYFAGVLCKGYSAGVLARLGLDSTFALHVEAEGHNNWF